MEENWRKQRGKKDKKAGRDGKKKIGKVYCLGHTDVPKLFFIPRHIGHSCTNVIDTIVVF
jgi:hypothetical protein